jgi:hypothetical protein
MGATGGRTHRAPNAESMFFEISRAVHLENKRGCMHQHGACMCVTKRMGASVGLVPQQQTYCETHCERSEVFKCLFVQELTNLQSISDSATCCCFGRAPGGSGMDSAHGGPRSRSASGGLLTQLRSRGQQHIRLGRSHAPHWARCMQQLKTRRAPSDTPMSVTGTSPCDLAMSMLASSWPPSVARAHATSNAESSQ